jgi:hypothetical protein
LKKFIRHIPFEIRYLLKVYFFGIIIFAIFRIFLILFNLKQAGTATKSLIGKSFIMGWRFDTVVSCYVLAFPALLLIINLFLKRKSYILNRFIVFYTISIYSIAFLICCVDIPYFRHYLTRLTVSIFNWKNNPMFMFKIVFEDGINYFFIAFFFLLIFITSLRVKAINASTLLIHKESLFTNRKHKLQKVFYSILLIGLVFLGIRGRIALKSPIQWGTAYTSDNNFTNQLGLNPNFTFLKSTVNSLNPDNKKIHFIDNDSALKTIEKSFEIKGDTAFASPIARRVNVKGEPLNANIVIVIMEAMGLTKTGLDNNPINMTPHLDSLSKVSYTFTNVFCRYSYL